MVFWLICWSLAAALLPQQVPGATAATYWTAGVGTAVAFFASLLAHELGHAVVARRASLQVEGITLCLLGGVAKLDGEATNPRAELGIAAVGPLISLVLAAVAASVAAVSAVAAGTRAAGAGATPTGAPADPENRPLRPLKRGPFGPWGLSELRGS